MTTSELMQKKSQQAKGNITQLGRKYLEGNSKYDYCPHCVQEAKQKGLDYKEYCKPVALVTTCEYFPQYEKQVFDKHYECVKCGRKMSEWDWVVAYCMRADGTKYNEPKKQE